MTHTQTVPVLPRFEPGTTVDEAWALSNAGTYTNLDLKDGDLVELMANTRGDFVGGALVVPGGTMGTVAVSKVHRSEMSSGDTARFFAAVDVVVEGQTAQLHVPHAALRVLTQPLARPDAVRRNR